MFYKGLEYIKVAHFTSKNLGITYYLIKKKSSFL
jgi:hypothetical protein